MRHWRERGLYITMYECEIGSPPKHTHTPPTPSIDPVTGGPSKEGVGSPLDHMTEEEKEAEAEKLHELLEKLDQ